MNQSAFILSAGFIACSLMGCPASGADDTREIQPASDAPKPMTPAQSAATMQLADGFRIELVASEPIVEEPSCIAFDEQGRLFVCELHGYNVEGHLDVSQLNKSGKLDKQVRRIRWELEGGAIADEAAQRQYGVVKMLTDTDGDGVMDHSRIWADDLPPCYGVVAARGGIIVTCAPDIIFLADRDGDGQADERETLFTGFNRRVMERGVNNPRWGLDNWIYVGGGGDGGTISGPKLPDPFLLGNTDFRIRPDGSAIEAVNGHVGTFGMTINDVGDRFPSSGGQPAIYALPIPYRYLKRNPWVTTPETNHSAAAYHRGFRISRPHPWRVKRGEDPEWVKFYGTRETNSNYFSGGCSNEYYGDVLFPKQYRGNLFYCEPSLNIVHRCIVERDGAGYRGHRAANEQASEFLASTDQWFRPMNLRVGPDGALYIVDMYREIIEDYSAIPRFLQQQYGLDKGSRYGRIWRLLPESAAEIAAQRRSTMALAKHDAKDLVDVLGDPNAWRRRTAQRLLIERNATAAARSIAAKIRADADPQTCIAALYTLDGLEAVSRSEIFRALDHEDYGVRIHALRLSDRWLGSDESIIGRVVAMAGDSDASVRLQVAVTLGQSRDPVAIEALLELAMEHGHERWMSAAILSSANGCADQLLAGLLKQTDIGEGPLRLLSPLAATIAGQRNVAAMSRVLSDVVGQPREIQVACLQGLVQGLSRSKQPVPRSQDDFAALSDLLQCESQPVRDLATKLSAVMPVADRQQLMKIFDQAANRACDNSIDREQRRQAISVLASGPFELLARTATQLLDSRQPPAVQLAVIRALESSPDARVGEILLDYWGSYTPTVRVAVMEAVFSRVNRLPILLDAVEQQLVGLGEISAAQRERLLTNGDPEIARRAKVLFENSRDAERIQRHVETYRQSLSNTRDIERGKKLFRTLCLDCHKLGDEGQDVGPRLGTIMNRPDETILLDLLHPSGRIEPEYRSYIVVTEAGHSLTGILASESATSITLRGAKGVSRSVLRREIDVMKASDISLMPANLHEQVSPQDVADLLGFLRSAFAMSSTGE